MDKNIFEQEIFNRLGNGGASLAYNGWHNHRRDILRSIKNMDPNNRSIDYHLISAMIATGVPRSIEKIVPGISERLTQYLNLQSQLCHDLTRLNKLVSKETAPFQDWLKGY